MVSIKVENLVIKYKTLNSTSIQRNFFQKRKKRYTYTAVDDISFEVKKGEIFGLTGRNGSGKSTLLRAIGGMLAPDSGKVDLMGSRYLYWQSELVLRWR